MAEKLQPVRGTHDILPEENRLRRHVIETWRKVSALYGYGEISTPIFEFSEVFHRTLGDTSDVVAKETYTFTDRGGESITLRPEFTAACVRAFISEGLQDQLPIKWFYQGPAFRYERPQKGRLRQFHQVGAELLGIAGPEGDIEIIALAAQALKELGLKDKITLELNTLGDIESRNAYRGALVEYLAKHQDRLSEESKIRLTKNPLRILDSKSEQDQEIIANAPPSFRYLTKEATSFFEAVHEGLSNLGIVVQMNYKLVRGLDYYHHTVFEFTSPALGAQNTVLAGGRYDGLVKLMGGSDTPGVGFAAGVERLCALIDTESLHGISAPRPVVVIPLGEELKQDGFDLVQRLRASGIAAELLLSGNLGKRLKRADKLHAVAALLLGEDEKKRGVVTLRDLDKGEQNDVSLSGLDTALAAYRH